MEGAPLRSETGADFDDFVHLETFDDLVHLETGPRNDACTIPSTRHGRSPSHSSGTNFKDLSHAACVRLTSYDNQRGYWLSFSITFSIFSDIHR